MDDHPLQTIYGPMQARSKQFQVGQVQKWVWQLLTIMIVIVIIKNIVGKHVTVKILQKFYYGVLNNFTEQSIITACLQM